MIFDPDALLAAMPVRRITPPPAGTPRPRLRFSASGGPYNGYTPAERYRTAALANWLQAIGCMARPDACSICGAPAKHHHAEDYFDLRRWVDICVGCHQSLHKRFASPVAWLRRLSRLAVGDGHWARLVSPEPFDLAALLKARGAAEPTVEGLFERGGPPRRRPRQRYGEMGIPPGGRLVHPEAPGLDVIVVDDTRLLWRGEEHSLTSLTLKLTRECGLPASRDLWRFEGRSLKEIYDATYG